MIFSGYLDQSNSTQNKGAEPNLKLKWEEIWKSMTEAELFLQCFIISGEIYCRDPGLELVVFQFMAQLSFAFLCTSINTFLILDIKLITLILTPKVDELVCM